VNWRTRRELDLDAEIQAHLHLAAQDRVRNGETPEDAAISARCEFGNATRVKEMARDAWAWSRLIQLCQDFRHAIRSLARTAGSTAACIATLSLGIAAATAMFTLIDSLLLRPPPYPEPERLVAIDTPVSWGDALDMERHATTLQSVGIYRKRTWGFTDTSHAPVEVVLAGMVTRGFFATLGIAPASGPAFADRALWLTHTFWRKRYNAKPDIAGAIVELNDIAYRVAGVLPAGFRFPMDGENPDVYIPLDRTDYCCSHDLRTLSGIARLNPDSSRAEASDQISALSGWRYNLSGLQSGLMGDRVRPLLLLGLAAALLLLVAATNAASILLARAARHARETALKISLGAQWKHLIVERALQGVAIAAAAATSGIVLAALAIHAASALPGLAESIAAYGKIAPVRIDGRVILFACTVALLSATGAALVPLFLRRGALRGRNFLVIVQIALSAILLCTGAAIFDRLRDVLNEDKGFRTDRIVIAGIGIPEKRYDTDAKMTGFHERVVARLAAIPGVTAAGVGAGLPMGMRTQFLLHGQSLPIRERPWAMVGVASPDLLRLLEIDLLHGRGFTPEDRSGHPFVALVNRRFAGLYGQSPGARLQVKFWNGHMQPWTEFEIVGVVADARNRGLDLDPEPEIYLSAFQIPLDGAQYFIRTPLPAASVTAAFRKAVWSEDPNLQRMNVRPFAPWVERDIESRRPAIWLLGIFAGLALALATAGLGASISGWVTESLPEIGIRSALGETSRGTVWRVLAKSLRIAAVGMIAAIPGTYVALVLLRNRISGIGEARPASIMAVAVLIVAAALVSSAIPAYRAARLNPMDVLRRT